MVRRDGSYDMAGRNVPCCTAQNDTSICAESTISSIFFIPICQPQCIDIVGKFTPTRYFFFSQLSYVLYKTWRKLGASSGGVRRTVAKTTKIGLFAGHLPKNRLHTSAIRFRTINARKAAMVPQAAAYTKTCARRCRREMQWQKSLSTVKQEPQVCRSVIVWSILQVWSWSALTRTAQGPGCQTRPDCRCGSGHPLPARRCRPRNRRHGGRHHRRDRPRHQDHRCLHRAPHGPDWVYGFPSCAPASSKP